MFTIAHLVKVHYDPEWSFGVSCRSWMRKPPISSWRCKTSTWLAYYERWNICWKSISDSQNPQRNMTSIGSARIFKQTYKQTCWAASDNVSNKSEKSNGWRFPKSWYHMQHCIFIHCFLTGFFCHGLIVSKCAGSVFHRLCVWSASCFRL